MVLASCSVSASYELTNCGLRAQTDVNKSAMLVQMDL